MTDAEVLQIMFAEKGGEEKWARVYQGEICPFYPSHSEAVPAIIFKLRFYSGADRSQVRRLLEASGLSREKWNDKRGNSTWIECEIARVFARGGKVYTPNRRAPSAKFAQVPTWVIQEASPAALRIYCGLAVYANGTTREATPAAGTIAHDLNISRSRVFEALKALERIGAIERMNRFGTSNRYRLPMKPANTPVREMGRLCSQ